MILSKRTAALALTALVSLAGSGAFTPSNLASRSLVTPQVERESNTSLLAKRKKKGGGGGGGSGGYNKKGGGQPQQEKQSVKDDRFDAAT